jgi:hypothetical protein
MITITEFILFTTTMAAIAWGLHWKYEARSNAKLLHIMLTDQLAREQIVANFEKFKRALQ